VGKISVDLLIREASELVTVKGFSGQPARGDEMGEAGIIPGGSVAVYNGKIVSVGTHEEVMDQIEITTVTEVVDARGMVVMPGFIDAHTHLVYAGSREHELTLKLAGMSYLEILERGGGILNTVAATRAASRSELLNQAQRRVNNMLSMGTTTVEGKSGYGLTTFTELMSLEIMAEINRTHPLDIIPTFMGAHTYPSEYKDRPSEYVNLVCTEMIPAVANQGLARFCDVFCEQGAFNADDSRRILKCAMEHGLEGKIHADELAVSGGSLLAGELRVRSAEHLLEITSQGIESLAAAGVIGVLLPATSFYLAKGRFAPAREMTKQGIPLALGTDCNPGSSPTESMQLVLTLACLYLKLSPAESIVAATINSAHALGVEKLVGSLENGKQADMLVMEIPNHAYLPYHFGGNHVNRVIKRGRTVFRKE